MSDLRPGNHASRSVRDAVCEAMGSAVPEGFRPQAPPLPPVAAGTDEPERVAVDRVAADAAVFDTDAATYYGHGMECHDSAEDTFGRGGASFRDSGEGVPTGSLRDAPGKAARPTWVVAYERAGHEAVDDERDRLARLSRWQEQR